MAEFVNAGDLNGIPLGGKRAFRAGGKDLLLCRVGEEEVYCVENRCPHAGAPLEKVELSGTTIECPRHGARFDLRDGRVLKPPAASPLKTFSVRIQPGGTIQVDLGRRDGR